MHTNKKEEGRVEEVSVMETVVATSPPKSDRFLAMSILIAAVVIGGSILVSTFYRGGSSAPGIAVTPGGGGTAGQGAGQAAPQAEVAKLGPRDVALGDANAPVTLIEYGDYQCPFCGLFFTQVEPTLKQNYINSGKVKMVFRNFAFLGPESTASAEAAECAKDQNKFWAFHDALYAAEVADGHENNGNLTRDLFISLAAKAGLNAGQFASCVDSHKYAATITEANAAATAAGVNSTPTTFINGKKVTDASGQSVGANSSAILNAVAAALKG